MQTVLVVTGPILERKSMHSIFQKKGEKWEKMAKYFKIWAQMYKIWKYFEKGQPRACDYRMHETGGICPELNHLADFAVSWKANFVYEMLSNRNCHNLFIYLWGKTFCKEKKIKEWTFAIFSLSFANNLFFNKRHTMSSVPKRKLCDWNSCLSVFWKLGNTLINKGSVIFLSSLIIWKFIINFHEIAIKKNCKISKLANWSNFSKNSGNLLNFLTNVSSLMCKGKAFISYE